jgi:4-amino-4-deoxy-L-arabinose transferase-like glycosyltransferase
MENLYYGILTISICIAGYSIAFKQYSKNNIIPALVIIMLCGLLLRIFTAADLFLYPWDERYHALVAKNIFSNPLHPTLYYDPILPYDYTNWTANHTWVHKQPVPLWIMAFSMSIFGFNEIALRLPSIILTTLGIGITFYIAKYLFNDRIGIIAAFLYSIHGLIIELSAGRVATDHVDIFFLFFIQLAVLLAIKFFQGRRSIYNILCGVSIGLAILSKWLPALIVLPIWLLLAIDSKKLSFREIILNFVILLSVVVFISAPWQLYIFNEFPLEAKRSSENNIRHITEALEGHGRPFYYHFDRARIIYGELIYLPFIWFFYKTFRRPGNFRRLIIVIWILIPFMFFSFAKTKMQAYTLFTAPAIFILTAVAWEYLYRYRNRFKQKGIIVMSLILLIAFPVRYSLERIKPFTVRERNPQWSQELKELRKHLKGEDKVVIFNAGYPIETMFYTNSTAYSIIPDPGELSAIKDDGYVIFIRRELDCKQEYNNPIEGGDIILTRNNIIYNKW